MEIEVSAQEHEVGGHGLTDERYGDAVSQREGAGAVGGVFSLRKKLFAVSGILFENDLIIRNPLFEDKGTGTGGKTFKGILLRFNGFTGNYRRVGDGEPIEETGVGLLKFNNKIKIIDDDKTFNTLIVNKISDGGSGAGVKIINTLYLVPDEPEEGGVKTAVGEPQ